MDVSDQLFDNFPETNKKDWQSVAERELGNTNSTDSLHWKTSDNLQFAPYYTSADNKDLQYLRKFDFRGESTGYHKPRTWHNLPPVAVADEAAANASALHHLKNEADGILFSCTSPNINFHILLQEIEWQHCNVSFFIPADFLVDDLKAYIQEKKYTALSGAIYQESPSQNESSFGLIDNVKACGIFVRPSTATDEIAHALTEAVHIIEVGLQKKSPLESIIRSISFSLPVSGDFLLDISKLKALRLLWYQVTQAYNITSYLPGDLYLHTRSDLWTDQRFHPHENMLKGTVATMASVCGGTNGHTVFPEQENELMQNRIARNISFILREESHFGNVSDPLAGSYTIEQMTHAIAQSAWTKFQRQS